MALALLVGMVGVPATASDGELITGTVRMLDTEEPVAGVVLYACDLDTGGSCSDYSGPTGDDGRFELRVPTAEGYDVYVDSTGDVNLRAFTATVAAPGEVDVWAYRPVGVSGTVVLEATGEPLRMEGITVSFFCKVEGRGEAYVGGRTDQDGNWATDWWGAPAGCEITDSSALWIDEYFQYVDVEVTGVSPRPATGVEVRVASTPEAPEPPSFADVGTDHPFHRDITRMAVTEAIQGYSDATFRPTVAVTRQAAAAFLWRLWGSPTVNGEAGFSDVPPDHPFHDAIAWMVDEDITSGFPDGTFRPTAPVTRQAAAAFLWRFAGEVPVSEAPQFTDVPADHEFGEAIAWMADWGISEGWSDGTFRPNQDVTRQSMAAFLSRYWFDG